MEDKLDEEWRMFKYMAIAAHPEETNSILKALDAARDEAERMVDEDTIPEWAAPITDEEIPNYRPYGEDAQSIIDELRQFGVAVREVPDQ